MSVVKYNKVKKIVPFGAYHQTFTKVWNTIPDSLIKQLTSKQLVGVCNAVYEAYQAGGKDKKDEILQDGALDSSYDLPILIHFAEDRKSCVIKKG